MIVGILSDTHKDRMNALSHIMKEFKKQGVEFIIHSGDIDPKHLNPELFNNLPVICALTEDDLKREGFETAPPKWKFTKPGDRVRYLPDGTRVYVGHKRAFEFLAGSETKLFQTMDEIRRDYDGLRLMTSGHTHHQIWAQTRLVNFINPGAVEDSFDGYEFAIYNTQTENVLFSRVLPTKPTKKTVSVGVISDSLDISQLDPEFWKKLAEEFQKREVKYIIHCGNLKVEDIGRKELENFEIHYNLRKDQKNHSSPPENWHLINPNFPIVEIEGYRFCIQLDLGAELSKQSESQMYYLCQDLRRKYPEVKFVLCGFTNDAFLEEGPQIKIINPGDVNIDRNFVVITLPKTEIFFGHVPIEPLTPLSPPIKSLPN